MSKLKIGELLRGLAADKGVQLDEDELEELGLSGGEEEHTAPGTGDVLSETLPGRAAGQVELFLGADSTVNFDGIDSGDGLMWYPIIREGQWAVRPSTVGTKKRIPLKVVGGRSKNQRREIGLQDLLDAHEDEAVQHVTVPSSHNNTVLENQGFIDKMKIVTGTVKDKATKADKQVKVLMGGYRITEPETKAKMSRGTIANRSAGILYDYVNTETGKKYAAVVEHVALTNKPWITGMISFGRKLREGRADPVKVETVALSLSDELEVAGDDYALALMQEAALEDSETDFLAEESSDWSKEDSPGWLRQQVDSILRDARQEKIKARGKASSRDLSYEDYPLHYRCVEARPGQALIADDYGENANHWTAAISLKDGAVQLAPFDQWSPLKKAFIPDERPAPPADKLPLDKSEQSAVEGPPKTRLQLAQEARKMRSSGSGPNSQSPREVVESDMAGTDNTSGLQLSAEAQALLDTERAERLRMEEQLKLANEKLARVTNTVNNNEVDAYIKAISSDGPGGLGLSEERGFSGVLVEIRQLMLADDGEPALQSDHFAEGEGDTGEITFSDGIKRIFGAISKATEGKKALGEQLSQSADPEKVKGNKENEQFSEEKSPGKPGADDKGEELSTEKKVDALAEANPQLAALMGRTPAAATANQNGGE